MCSISWKRCRNTWMTGIVPFWKIFCHGQKNFRQDPQSLNIGGCKAAPKNVKVLAILRLLLTVEQYAEQYGVESVTVRQWIRRGKIRTATKYGKEWRIPILTEPPTRGYSPASYSGKQPLTELPKSCEFLVAYDKVLILQIPEAKRQYQLFFSTTDNIEIKKCIQVTEAEKEKLELFLIAHPLVKYDMDFCEQTDRDRIKQ